jgi:hypothetical protein
VATIATPQPAGRPPERLRSFELMADTTLVFIRCGDVERPVLKVVERPDQVVIIIRSEQDGTST